MGRANPRSFDGFLIVTRLRVVCAVIALACVAVCVARWKSDGFAVLAAVAYVLILVTYAVERRSSHRG